MEYAKHSTNLVCRALRTARNVSLSHIMLVNNTYSQVHLRALSCRPSNAFLTMFTMLRHAQIASSKQTHYPRRVSVFLIVQLVLM